MRTAAQHGYILLPVIVVITLVAAIALLMNTESALESNTTASELDAQQAQYVAKAGLNHALWLSQQAGCGPYGNLTDEPLGNDKYSSSLTTDLGSTSAVTISVDQDSWIRSDLPTENKAFDLKLHTRNEALGTERPLLRYDLSTIAANSSILSATAWFYITNAHAAGPIDIHLTSADWTETDATWDSMNANMDGAVLATIPSQAVTGLWLPVNLTAQVQAWVNGQPNFGITLNSTVDGVHGQYNSRESANPPYLEVVVGTPPTSPATLKAVGTLANGINRSITRNDVTLVQQPAGFSLSRVTTDSGQDAMLDSFYSNRDYGVHELEVSLGSGSTVENSVLQFELPAIAPGARIISAQLDLFHYVTTRSTGNLVVDVHRVTRSWVEGTHDGTGTADGATWDTWDGSSSWSSAGGDYAAASVASSAISAVTGDWESFEIGDLVQGWIDGSYPNYGLLLKGTGDFDISFASREDANAALHPMLSISYACACGEVCVTPQGSGNLLMAVINPTVLVAEDQQAKDLFESWGYTVSVVGESSNQATYDAAVAANDVVFISETVNSNSVGSKLAGATIGVVSQDGVYNPDLGLASGSALKVGAEINVTDTDHYITRVFATGPLQVYAAGMEQLIVSSSPTAGQQVLADIGGDASLVALEKGDAMEGGGSAAGRRVVLPLGTRYRFDWDRLNANGRVLVQRALAWGMNADKTASATPLLLVVANPSSLSAQESAKKALIESWDYSVNLIDDGATQSEYDAALGSNSVAYVPQGISATGLGTKLNAATIGVVNEEGLVALNLDLTDSLGKITESQINVIDNAHSITSGLALGLTAITTSPQNWTYCQGGLAKDAQFLATTNNGASVYKDSLFTVEVGGELTTKDNFTPGRRVQLPWGYTGFDINTLNATGLTIMQRAIEWASSDPPPLTPLAHWKLDETSGLTAVDSVGGHDGTLMNGPAWTPGQVDGALAFDGSDDHVDLTSDAELDDLFVGGATVMAWINPASWGGNGYGRIFDKSSSPSATGDGWAIRLNKDNGGLNFGQGFTSGRGWWRFAESSIDFDTWQHIALAYDASSTTNDPIVYLNGSPVAVTRVDTPSGAVRSDAALDLRLGSHASTVFNVFDGSIDDARIYDRLLSAAEIADIAAVVLPGPVAHWKLDETSGTTAVDSEGGHDGTLVGGTWTTGTVGGALDFNGSTDYVLVADDPTLDITEAITLMAWFKPNKVATQYVLKKAISGSTDGYELALSTTGKVVFRLNQNSQGNTYRIDSTTSYPSDGSTWMHVVATYDGAVQRLYINGSEEVSNPASITIGTNDTALSIGAQADGIRLYDGTMDDVRIYNYALSPADIAAAAGGGGGGPGYKELYRPWNASSPDTWETVGLSAYGVPANAVVEVAIINSDTGKEQFGGVRAVGSSLERRFRLHEAEGGGSDVVTMHVQADTSSQIQHYAEDTGQVSFILLGYWTLGTYVELFENFSASSSNTWVIEDTSDEGLGANQVAEVVMQNTDASAQRLAGVRSTATLTQRRFNLHEAEGGGVDAVSMIVNTDNDSEIEVFAQDASDIDFYVVGYWSTPPGTYTENGGVHGQVSTLLTWETSSLASFGVPANAIAQFLITNEAASAEVEVGIRQIGSTLNRIIDIQEAESGGSDATSMHVNVDAGVNIEWYAQYGGGTRFFYPVGWWVLSP